MNTCGCASLVELQAMLVADGEAAPTVGVAYDLARMEQRGYIERCPEHPRNWRLAAWVICDGR